MNCGWGQGRALPIEERQHGAFFVSRRDPCDSA
jgi:hypothetical protein